MKRYTELTQIDKLDLNNQDFADAVKLEAIQQGIQVPVTLSEALKTSEWRGYQFPANGLRVWVLDSGSQYGAKIGYLTPEGARNALTGSVVIGEVYRDGKSLPAIRPQEQVQVKEMVLGDFTTSKGVSIPEMPDDPDPKFNELLETCRKDWEAVLVDDYTRRAKAERWAEYLRLAKGDAEIARGFWAQAGEGSLPVGV